MVVKSPEGAKGEAQLIFYWTKDPRCLAKWADKPHPWTSLRHELDKFLNPEEAKRTATNWYHLVFGDFPGSDTAKLRGGHPIRGKVIGPG